MVGILMLLLFGMIILGVPISFCIAGSSLAVMLLDPAMQPITMVQRLYTGLNSFVIIAIPLFLLTAEIMNLAGITDKLINLSYALVGHIRGGLAHVNIVVSMVFAGISGSSTADTAGIGSVLIPAMEKRGYSRDFSVVVTAASSTMGVIIPPSIISVIYASTVGISVGALFIAGVMPGILIAMSQMVVSYIYAVKCGYPCEKRQTAAEKAKAVFHAVPPLISPLLIIGGIVGGYFTPTEAAVISVAYCLLLSVIYRTITPRTLWQAIVNTGLTSSVTLFCIGVASVFSYILSFYRVPDMLGGFLLSYTGSHLVFLFVVFALFLIAGTFMDATPAIIMLAPIVAPIANSIGVDPVHLGIIVVITMGLGLVTPPYGLCLLLACQIGKIKLQKVMPTMMVFIIVNVAIILLFLAFPDLSLWMPRFFTPHLMPAR